MSTFVISGAAVAVTLIISITVLILEGRDPGQVITFVTPYLTLAVPTLLNVYSARQAKVKLDVVDTKIDNVAQSVNGHLDDLSRKAGIKPDSQAPSP